MGFPITWIIVFLFLESASLGETAIPRANQKLAHVSASLRTCNGICKYMSIPNGRFDELCQFMLQVYCKVKSSFSPIDGLGPSDWNAVSAPLQVARRIT